MPKQKRTLQCRQIYRRGPRKKRIRFIRENVGKQRQYNIDELKKYKTNHFSTLLMFCRYFPILGDILPIFFFILSIFTKIRDIFNFQMTILFQR